MRAPATFALFETPIGRCAIAWRNSRICGIALPDRDDEATIAALRRGSGDLSAGLPPPNISAAIKGIEALLGGDRNDLTDIPLDLDAASPFERDVYVETLKIPAGTTRTYGEIARALGDPLAARAVGRALGRHDSRLARRHYCGIHPSLFVLVLDAFCNCYIDSMIAV